MSNTNEASANIFWSRIDAERAARQLARDLSSYGRATDPELVARFARTSVARLAARWHIPIG